MKKFITKKEAASRFNLYSVGYCSLQQLLKDKHPQYYHSGVYGWNCDYYLTPFDLIICTGYRPHGRKIPYEITSKYEALAAGLGWREQQKREELFINFCKEVQEHINKI